jgi:hypothetical protein
MVKKTPAAAATHNRAAASPATLLTHMDQPKKPFDAGGAPFTSASVRVKHQKRGERVHHSHHHEMPRTLRGRRTLTSALAEEDDFDSLQQDQDVEHQAVILDVVKVVLKLLGGVLL